MRAGAYKPFAPMPLYLVSRADAPKPHPCGPKTKEGKPTGFCEPVFANPPHGARFHFVGRLDFRRSPRNVRLDFHVPPVPAGAYEFAIYCDPCHRGNGGTLITNPSPLLRVRAAAPLGRQGHFSSRGITFTYPPSWNVTTQPLSNGLEPVYRFAVANFSFHRTPRDIGPCLEGIAKQRPPTGVLAFMREAVGGDARRSHAGARPKTFRLPAPTEQAACLGPGSTQFTFTQAGRVFYLWLSVAPKAPRWARSEIQKLLGSMKITKVASKA